LAPCWDELNTTSRRCRGRASVGRPGCPMRSRTSAPLVVRHGRRDDSRSLCRPDPTWRVATVWGVRSVPRRRCSRATPTSKRRKARPSPDATRSQRLDACARRLAASGAPNNGHRTAITDVALNWEPLLDWERLLDWQPLDAEPVHANRARRGLGDWRFGTPSLVVTVQAECTASRWPVRRDLSRYAAARNSRAAAPDVRASGVPAIFDPSRG
jgi:hypothetical protein